MHGTVDPSDARRWIAERQDAVRERLAAVEARLTEVRTSRAEWTDEEHDPEGFTLTFEWQQAEGARGQHATELAALDAAEARVTAGTYGTCTDCGQPIPAEQLELRPARTTCVSCEERRPTRRPRPGSSR